MIFGKYLNKHYIRYIHWFIFGVIALLIVDYYQVLLPEIIGKIIDSISDGSFNHEDNVKYILEIVKIALIVFTGRFTWRFFLVGVSAKIDLRVREKMFSHAQKLSLSYYKEHKTGGMMALFTNDLQTIRQMVAYGLIMLVDATFLAFLVFIKMYKSNHVLAFVCIAPLLLLALLGILIGRAMTKRYKERQKCFERLSDFSHENFSGISVIKAFVKENFEIKEFERINKDNLNKNVDFSKFSLSIDLFITLIISLLVISILAVGSYFVIFEDFSAGDLTAFILLFNNLLWPMMAISQFINLYSQANASYKRVKEFLDSKIEIVDEEVDNINIIKGKIEFRNLSFKYPDGHNNVLEDISFTVNEGEMVGIIGKTGCGKTTIVDLILRLYNLKKGVLFIDDKDIMEISFKKLRDNIGYVPQDNFLFSDTISSNIAFAFNEEMKEENIVFAASLADVHSNIEEFENKYNTILGERGVTLSGGQKQRVSIARAFIKDPSILILDDSVSAVDTKTEETILNNIRKYRKGKTTIIIAHRISTVQNLDKIIVMDSGKIIGEGTHEYLEKNLDEYQKMILLQSLEEEIKEGDSNE